ncbi:MocR-like pyridoxine biosynthesis transcription factor PdxR [Ideonella sp. BN130291]|uniref:MocR-like pyridoxine biosynthesis transcription factor PdxR n=1 Tax=Ideonella sp. BN130291 TaxID=3112940 RepID=UPI002E269521|nr:PLP-dependent aminotransferase family protein [Ideonella sp. BN130291]
MIDTMLLLRHQLAQRPAGQTVRRRLAEVVRAAVIDGTLEAGAVLPASRVLARELGLGRNTVLHAYEQLTTEGYLTADRQGTVVCHLGPRPGAAPTQASVASPPSLPPLARRALPSTLPPGEDETPLPFLPGIPALDQFPLERWRRRVAQAWRVVNSATLAGRDVCGEPVLRAAIAGYLRASRGVRCEPEQVVVTSGTQESLALCAQLLADPGERVWMEHPGYMGASTAFVSAGLQLVPVPVDSEGLAPTAALWRRQPPRLVYTTPSHQYPLGVPLSLPRRLALIEQARRTGSWILEDDYDSEFCRGVPLAAMQGLAPDAPVVYLGTFSKTLYPALRLAYAVLPEAAVNAVMPALARRLAPGRVAEQEALAAFIHDGEFTAHLRRMRRLYAERQAALRQALQQAWPMPPALSPGEGGMHLALALPPTVDDREVVRHAQARGLEPRALSTYTVGGGTPLNGLVLGYANVPAEQVNAYVRTLAWAVRQALRCE